MACTTSHEFRDLFNVLHQRESKASTAMHKEDEAAHKFDYAKSESNLRKRLQQYEHAYHACEQAMARYDQLDMLIHPLREALHVCSPQGKLRTVEGIRSELTLILQRIEEIDGAALTQARKPMQVHIDDIVVPFQQAEAMYGQLLAVVPHHALELLVLAWHHDHVG